MTNPLLEKIKMPGMTFRLPSRALFYDDTIVESEVLDRGEVYVSPMTVMDEMTMKSTDKLLNGTAVSEVFARCVPHIKDTKRLLATDVDFLIIALHIVSYGSATTVTYNHECGEESKEHKYTIDLDDIMNRVNPLDEDLRRRHVVDLSNSQKVTLRPHRYGDILRIQDVLEKIRRVSSNKTQLEDKVTELLGVVSEDDANLIRTRQQLASASARHEKSLTEYLRVMTVSSVARVDDVTNADHIAEWGVQLQVSLRDELITALNAIDDWGLNMSQKITCKDCQAALDIPVEINPVTFFTSRSNRETLSE